MAASKANKEVPWSGLAVSDGVVFATAVVLKPKDRGSIPCYRIEADAVDDEVVRLDQALSDAAKQLSALIDEVAERIGPAQANIFVAQKMMVEDAVLRSEIVEAVRSERLNVEAALEKTFDNYEKLLQEVDDEYLSERASDIGELRRRLHELFSISTTHLPDEEFAHLTSAPHIIVAADLAPSETVQLNAENTVGFITEHGGTASHAAILARAMGIPSVSGIAKVAENIQTGDPVLLNGDTGEVIQYPTEETLSFYPGIRRAQQQAARRVDPVEGFTVMANIGLGSEVSNVEAVAAEGLGLYRTEFEFLAAGQVLDEEAQYRRYRDIAVALDGQPFHARLLDLGGDKDAPHLKLPVEENPALGFRGARLLLGRPDLLIPQARAMARASCHGPIRLIYPMIVDVEQFLVLRERVRQAIQDISGHNLKHGIMFEVPSACLLAAELFEVADFGSVGTNDLIQYLFAIDRNNENIAEDYSPDKPVFWKLLGDLAAAAHAADKPLSICGEIGGQPQYLPRIIDLGINCVSVSPRQVALARVAAKRHLAVGTAR
jgi:phosphoenolpyruvate-protein phosphotransferase (PTS system enzyme I)